jgi:hypothetical protein
MDQSGIKEKEIKSRMNQNIGDLYDEFPLLWQRKSRERGASIKIAESLPNVKCFSPKEKKRLHLAMLRLEKLYGVVRRKFIDNDCFTQKPKKKDL